LFFVTSRYVVLAEAIEHRPDLLEVELHVGPENVAVTTQLSVPLYRDGQSIWREGVAAVPIERSRLPEKLLLPACLDTSNRDSEQDERLNLNCAGYADILLALTHDTMDKRPVRPMERPQSCKSAAQRKAFEGRSLRAFVCIGEKLLDQLDLLKSAILISCFFNKS
jgi:hypothetical protein